MKHPIKKWITLVFVLGAILMLGACKKKAAPPPPVDAPAATGPSLSDCLAVGESQYGRQRASDDAELADDERH